MWGVKDAQELKRRIKMPYIKKSKRTKIDEYVANLLDAVVKTGSITGNIHPGVLNYTILKFLHDYIRLEGLDYTTINKVAGVLSCVDKEFYRTVVAPYEDKKRAENGAVSNLDI